MVGCLTERQFVPTAATANRLSRLGMANDTFIAQYLKLSNNNVTAHRKTLLLHKATTGSRLSKRMTYLLIGTFSPSPVPGSIPYTAFDIIHSVWMEFYGHT